MHSKKRTRCFVCMSFISVSPVPGTMSRSLISFGRLNGFSKVTVRCYSPTRSALLLCSFDWKIPTYILCHIPTHI